MFMLFLEPNAVNNNKNKKKIKQNNIIMKLQWHAHDAHANL